MTSFKLAIIAASLIVAGSARADQLVRKAGEWRSTISGMGSQPQTIDMCLSRTTMDQAMAKLAAGGHCTKRDMKQTGNIMTLDVVCDAMSMKGTAVMSGDTAYTSEMTMTMNRGGRTMTMHSITNSKWIGACKPGQVPMD